MPHPSAADVARLARVSGQTVSRVVTGARSVAPETRARVEQAMAELGYRPHRAARALRTGRTGTLGVIATSLRSVGNARTLEAITGAAARADYAVLVVTVQDGAEAALEHLADRRVDAAIVLNEATPLVEARRNPPIPIVFIDPATGAGPSVSTAHRAGSRAATAHLIATGERVIHHLAGPTSSVAARERELGWRDALRAHRLVEPDPIRADWTAAGAAHALTVSPELARVHALFCANDQMALGALRVMRERDLPLPAIVGFDDIEEAAHSWPSLSTVAQDFDRLGAEALRLSISTLDDLGEHRHEHVEVGTRVVVRESSDAAWRAVHVQARS